MGYAIKRQPLSVSALSDADFFRISDATDGTEKKCTLANLSSFVLASGSAAGTYQVYDITSADYGGAGDGSTDNSDAMDAVLTAIGSSTDETPSGAIIYFPPGRYAFSRAIELGDRSQIKLVGNGGAVDAPNKRGVSQIYYTGTDTHFIKVQESGTGSDEASNFTISGLDVAHSSSSFTGKLLHLDEAVATVQDCRFGYDYHVDATYRYLATGIYVENGSGISVVNCAFDQLDYGYQADEQGTDKSGFHFYNCRFYTCKTTGLAHNDTGVGSVTVQACQFRPLRTISAGVRCSRGCWIEADGFSVTGNDFRSPAAGAMYADDALVLEGTGHADGNIVIADLGCAGVNVVSGQVSVNANDVTAGPALLSQAGGQTLTGSGNVFRPPAAVTGTNVDLSIAGTTVTLTDGSAAFVSGIAGQTITISGATNAANNGTFPIASRPSATTLTYENASGVTESGAADYSIQATQAVRLGNTGDSGTLTVDMGPDRVEASGGDTFVNSYTLWNSANLSGRVYLPEAANDESDSGPKWEGLLHDLVFIANSPGKVDLTGDYTITAFDNGKIFSNYGSSGAIDITVPAEDWRGFKFTVLVEENFEVELVPGSGATLYNGGGSKTSVRTSTKSFLITVWMGSDGATWYTHNYGGWSTTP